MNSKKQLFRMSRKVVLTIAFGTSAVLLGAGALVFASVAQGDDDDTDLRVGHDLTTFVVEVKQHIASNRQNDIDPAEGDLVFTRGDTYVVDGTIYPDKSIPGGHGGEPLPNAPKLGKYTLRGVITTEFDQFQLAVGGARNVESTFAFATELFAFQDGSTILTDGLWPNAYFSVHRVVLGGTGRFRDVVGEVLDENIGEGTDGFCNTRLTFKIRKAATGGGRDR
jgi:hypothetical protein